MLCKKPYTAAIPYKKEHNHRSGKIQNHIIDIHDAPIGDMLNHFHQTDAT